MLFLISSHCLRCIIIGYSKWGRFGAILNSFALSIDALLLATESGGALVLFLIPLHCLRCIIIGYSKWGRFGAILNFFTLSKMHYYWLLKVGALWCYS